MLSADGKEKKKAEKQIHEIIWQIQEVKSKIDAYEKRATSASVKAEDSESDIHALVA